MPLDKKMRKEIIKLSLPYPHREKMEAVKYGQT